MQHEVKLSLHADSLLSSTSAFVNHQGIPDDRRFLKTDHSEVPVAFGDAVCVATAHPDNVLQGAPSNMHLMARSLSTCEMLVNGHTTCPRSPDDIECTSRSLRGQCPALEERDLEAEGCSP